MARRATVIRTCVGCRRRASVTELLRVVANANPGTTGFRLVPDPTRKLPGRGAHIHSDPACFAQAIRRRAFTRALRLSQSPDAAAVDAHVKRHA
ncbi:MAG TPA: YlxR family protein [Candidatus Stackebrandtia faecavium]|nr:YlxR family protein [Candidatus Stackebrandtia faecavium]